MGRVEKKLFAIADALLALDEERALVAAELNAHMHIDDDTQRDAVVSGTNLDRLEASSTAADVRRFQRRLDQIAAKRQRLEHKRALLLPRVMDN
ncbi:MAG TPA: hypothetical protein VIY70_03560 [Acidimicrobiia bacterium]